MSDSAYVTLLYNDAYLPGALVVGHSLIDHGSTVERVVLVTDEVSLEARTELAEVFTSIIDVTSLNNDHTTPGFQLLARPELNKSYTKLHVWSLVQFSKVVFLDADTLPLKNVDELFDSLDPEVGTDTIAAAPDIGWPDIFNSGVFVCCPNEHTYAALTERASSANSHAYSFDGGDQGLLNQYFEGRWGRIPFTYNVTPSSSYQYIPAYSYYQDKISIVHFIGSIKPWLGDASGNREMASVWRAVYRSKYGDIITSPLAGVATTSSDEARPVKPEELPIEVDETKLIPPDVKRWDATKYLPPLNSKPEAGGLHVTYHSNAWDQGRLDEEFHYPELGESKAVLWTSAQPPVERIYPEDTPRVTSPTSDPELAGILPSVEQSHDAGFHFPTFGDTVTKLPWEEQGRQRPKVERVYVEDLPPAEHVEQRKSKPKAPPRTTRQTHHQTHHYPDINISSRDENEEDEDTSSGNESQGERWDPAKKLDELAQYASKLAIHHNEPQVAKKSSTDSVKSTKESEPSPSSSRHKHGTHEPLPDASKFKLKPILKKPTIKKDDEATIEE